MDRACGFWLLVASSELRAPSIHSTALGFFRTLVERRWDYLGSDTLAPDLDLHARADLRARRRHVGQRNVLLQKRRGRAAGHVANLLACVVEHFVFVAGDP